MALVDRVIHPVAHEDVRFGQQLFANIAASLKPKKTSLRFTLADVAGAMGMLLAAGLPVPVAISWLAPRTRGEIGKLLRQLSENLELGADLLAELDAWANYGDPGLAELAEKLKLMIERGAGVSAQIIELAATLRSVQYRELLAKAGSNETKMLIPTVFLILPVTVLFALFPSLVVLQRSL